ncbi:MAG: ribosome maturation factor RimM [Solirubrobacteraceae bacterium]
MEAGAEGHPTGWLRAGRVGRPHGLDGSFHVVQANAALLDAAERVTVAGGEREIVRRAGTASRPILRLAGSDDREAAEALRGEELTVPRSLAPALEEDEWWAEDLVGCAVHDAGRHVGVVRTMLALPSCEVLKVKREDGDGELLVPLVSDAVREVDVDARSIEIDLRFLGAD